MPLSSPRLNARRLSLPLMPLTHVTFFLKQPMYDFTVSCGPQINIVNAYASGVCPLPAAKLGLLISAPTRLPAIMFRFISPTLSYWR